MTEGQILTNRLVRLACRRHLDDLPSAGARGLRFDLGMAQHAIAFFGFLRHSKGEWAGQIFALAPWQAFVVSCLFGWKRSDGLRRFRTAYCAVPRKNVSVRRLARQEWVDGAERRSGGCGGRRRGGPGPREQVVDPLDRVVGDAGEDGAQVGLGVEPVEDRGLDQGVEDRGAAAATVRAGEQIILAVMSTST